MACLNTYINDLQKKQVKDILGKFITKKLRAKEACRYLDIDRTRLHTLTTIYRNNPDSLDLSYSRTSATNTIATSIKHHVLAELAIEKEKIIDNPSVPNQSLQLQLV